MYIVFACLKNIQARQVLSSNNERMKWLAISGRWMWEYNSRMMIEKAIVLNIF